jgi:hypothetical protein
MCDEAGVLLGIFPKDQTFPQANSDLKKISPVFGSFTSK